MSQLNRRPRRGERGQALIMFVGLFTVVLVVAVIVVDIGLWLAERRSMQRAVDLAAVAAAQELPFNPGAACSVAYAYVMKNGYPVDPPPGPAEPCPGVAGDDNTVDIDLLCKNDLGDTSGSVCYDPVEPGPSSCDATQPCDAVRVKLRQGAKRLFSALPVFGIDAFDVDANAIAGVEDVAADPLRRGLLQ